MTGTQGITRPRRLQTWLSSCTALCVHVKSLLVYIWISWEIGKQWKQCQTLFLGAPKSLQMVIAAMQLKDARSGRSTRLNSSHSGQSRMPSSA